jgi:hypothetical protein
VSAPIHKSAVARDLQTRKEEAENRAKRQTAATTTAPQQPSAVVRGRAVADIVSSAKECLELLEELVPEGQATSQAQQQAAIHLDAAGLVRDLVDQARAAHAQLSEALDASLDRETEGVLLSIA